MRTKSFLRSPACAILAFSLECVTVSARTTVRLDDTAPLETFRKESCEPLTVRLSSDGKVKDAVFAVLINLIESNHFGCLAGSQLASTIESRHLRSRLPYQRLLQLRRMPAKDGARVVVKLDEKLDMRMPYRILWYRPACLRSDSLLSLREWSHPRFRMTFSKGSKEADHVGLENVHLFGLLRGNVEADIDGWLDRLLGAALDDMAVVGFAVFRHRNVWTGLAVGYNRAGAGRSGLFDFERDAIVYPMPDQLRAVARRIRKQIEILMKDERGPG